MKLKKGAKSKTSKLKGVRAPGAKPENLRGERRQFLTKVIIEGTAKIENNGY